MQKPLLKTGTLKVLIADDDENAVETLHQALAQDGYAVLALDRDADFIEKVSRLRPDLILLDTRIREDCGYELCRKIKEVPDQKHIPVIFITDKMEGENIVNGFDVGGADYIIKPFRKDEVRARVRTHLELRNTIQALDDKNRKLTELNDLMNAFVAMASHDLRSPITSIRGLTEIILEDLDELDPETLKKFITSIHTANNNMLFLLDDILDASLLENQKLVLNFETRSLQELIEERVAFHRTFAEKKKISIHPKLDALPKFGFDAERIAQVLDNLLSNAIKFSSPDNPVYVRLKSYGKHAKVSVEDLGPGIDPEDRGKLFQMFQKLKAKATGGEPSSGLGLAISKKVVEAHRGRMEVESVLGSGSTFSFEIPMR